MSNARSELARCQQLLGQAGASPAELADFARDLRRISSTDLARYTDYLQRQSPAHLTQIVEDMRRNGQYVTGPDSELQPGVPRGKHLEFTFGNSKIFPGTTRRINVYVPAAYTADSPACVYVGIDGLLFEAPTVFDNLIYKHDMPVTIAIGIESGSAESSCAPRNPRFNRSVEFDALDDNLARFLLEEVFPEVERHETPDGLPILLSRDPNHRAVGGLSTGGIGAFTVAWERPDAFRRVFTAIGTFVDMRGGDRYPALVRKTEPKPIRIFMQDGTHDQLSDALGEMGDWWLGNQNMNSALHFAGYEVSQVWGEGTHDAKHATALFPDAMRWLWKGWPDPVAVGKSKNVFLNAILLPQEEWQSIPSDDDAIGRLSADTLKYRALGADGRVYRTDPLLGTVYSEQLGGPKTVLDRGLDGPTGIALSPDGLWLAVAESRSHWGYIYRVQPDGTVRDRQRFYCFYVKYGENDSGTGAWVMDREGRLYAATRAGVQVFDRNGRVRAILPIPGREATNIFFGGEHLDFLYVLGANGKAYRRRLKIAGASPGDDSIVLPAAGSVD